MKTLRFTLALLLTTCAASSSFALVFGRLDGPFSLVENQNAAYTFTVENQFTGQIPSTAATSIEIFLPSFLTYVSKGTSSWYSWSYNSIEHKIVGTQTGNIPAWNGASPATYPTTTLTFNVFVSSVDGGAISSSGTGFAPYGGYESNMLFLNATPLPVTLADFSVSAEGSQIILSWVTTSETNSDHFEIEHSANARFWNGIGKLDAATESSVTKSYTFVHSSPSPKTNYYRLKMVDNDGSFAYSSIGEVMFAGAASAFVYPNPARESIYVVAKKGLNLTSIMIVDQGGRTVSEFLKPVQNRFGIGNLAAGTYIVRTRFEDNTETSQNIVIQP